MYLALFWGSFSHLQARTNTHTHTGLLAVIVCLRPTQSIKLLLGAQINISCVSYYQRDSTKIPLEEQSHTLMKKYIPVSVSLLLFMQPWLLKSFCLAVFRRTWEATGQSSGCLVFQLSHAQRPAEDMHLFVISSPLISIHLHSFSSFFATATQPSSLYNLTNRGRDHGVLCVWF